MTKESCPFLPISCRFCYEPTSTPQGFHIAVTTHNCGTSTKSVYPPGYTQSISSHKLPPFIPIINHSPRLPNTQTSLSFFFYAVTHCINPPLPRSTYLATSHINYFRNPIIPSSLNMAEPSENIFIQPLRPLTRAFANSFS